MIFSLSLDALYSKSGLTLLERIRQTRELGYKSFEFWSWTDKDLGAIRTLKDELDLHIGSFCSKHGNLVDPEERASFIEGVGESVAAAKELDCKHLIVTVGNTLPGVPHEEQTRSIIEGLRAVAPLVETAGVTIVLEPLNTLVNHKGYFLVNSSEAFAIVDEVASPYVKVLYDVYHQQVSEGNLIPTIIANIDKIGYFHIADHPGRGQIGTGEINYRNVLQAIRDTGYTGYIGLEYFQEEGLEDGLQRFLLEYNEQSGA